MASRFGIADALLGLGVILAPRPIAKACEQVLAIRIYDITAALVLEGMQEQEQRDLEEALARWADDGGR